MKQEKFSGHWGNGQRNAILLIMITVLVIYIAVPIYGVIQDAKEGETVFVIEGSDEGKGLLDKITDFLFDSNEISVSTTRVDLKGQVLLSDHTPYANGIVELRSTPRYTRTDSNGYFIFKSVEAGTHRINVLDESGNTLASCSVDISAARNTGDLVTTSFSEGTYKITISVNVKVLEIKLRLETDEDGNVEGISSLEVIKAETAPPDQPEDSETEEQTDLVDPEQPDDGNEEEPEDPEEPCEPGEEPEQPGTGGGGSSGGGSGGGTGGGPTPQPFQLGVYDSAVPSYGNTAAAQVNIFGTAKRIAPGMTGSYKFSVDNTRNNFRALYTVDFTSIDTHPAGSKIPMVYRLKAGNTYVAGDTNTWRSEDQLYQDTDMAANSKVVYTLEWYWPEGVNDNHYAELRNAMEYEYTLKIEVTAQQE